MNITPITLEGRVVRLEPLRLEHVGQLYSVSQEPIIWRYMPYRQPATVQDIEHWIRIALRAQDEGKELPFVTIGRETGCVIGSTRYLNIMPHDRGLEIGSTWLTGTARRTGINTECKYLLLGHAFETLRAIRVQFKTDTRNETSWRAIERLGAVKEGVLRNHMIMPDGYYRHSVYYSILDSEWPTIKAKLLSLMR
jgi:RimJ/RimL family protein N-acetyltransferase